AGRDGSRARAVHGRLQRYLPRHTRGAVRTVRGFWIEPVFSRLRRKAREDRAMDRLTAYRQIIRQVLAEYARYRPANGEIDTELVVDVERDHFELLHVGWDGVQRIHGPVIHIDIIGDKVWIQYDGTNRPVADEL